MRAAIAALALVLAAAALAEAPVAPAALPDVQVSLMAPALRVADCNKAQGYYQSALGMQVLMSRDLGRIHETLLAFQGQAQQPGVMLLCNVSAEQPPLKGLGGSRMIFKVGSIDALVQRLDAAGLPHPAIHTPGKDPVRVVNLTDPDGNELELVQTGAAPSGNHP